MPNHACFECGADVPGSSRIVRISYGGSSSNQNAGHAYNPMSGQGQGQNQGYGQNYGQSYGQGPGQGQGYGQQPGNTYPPTSGYVNPETQEESGRALNIPPTKLPPAEALSFGFKRFFTSQWHVYLGIMFRTRHPHRTDDAACGGADCCDDRGHVPGQEHRDFHRPVQSG